MMRGRKESLSKLEKEFWERFSELLLDDPEDNLNEIIKIMRDVAKKWLKEHS